MSHTPGPWEHAISGTAWSITADADPVYIAVVEMPGRMSKYAMCEANARLIATSPELLELANRVASLNPDAGEIGPGMLAQLVSDARRIVAKTK